MTQLAVILMTLGAETLGGDGEFKLNEKYICLLHYDHGRKMNDIYRQSDKYIRVFSNDSVKIYQLKW